MFLAVMTLGSVAMESYGLLAAVTSQSQTSSQMTLSFRC